MEIIKLNLIPSGVNPTCHCSQYDNGRVIRIDLFDGLTPYVLQSGDTVTLNVRKPDNTIVTASLTATQGNTYVNLVTTEQICACVGYNLCDLTITNGTTVIGTLNFIMQIERDVLADGVPSQSVIKDLDALVQEAVEADLGDDYYNKQEVNDLVAGVINDNEAQNNSTYSSDKITDLLGEKTNESDFEVLAGSTQTITPTKISKLNFALNGTNYYSNNSYETFYIPVVSGKRYKWISGKLSGTPYVRFVFATNIPANNVSGTFLREQSISGEQTVFEYTAAQNGYLSVSSYIDNISVDVMQVTEITDGEVYNIQTGINHLNNVVKPYAYFGYSGDKIDLTKRLVQYQHVISLIDSEGSLPSDTWLGGLAVYGKYAFVYFNAGYVAVYDLDNNILVATGRASVTGYQNHANNASFDYGATFANLPPIYISRCRNAGTECYVEQLTLNAENGNISCELIQTITYSGALWDGNTEVDWCVDSDNRKLVMLVGGNVAIFNIPSTSSSTVTLTDADIVSQSTYPTDYVRQGTCIYLGKLYMLTGYANQAKLRVIDLTNGNTKTEVDLNQYVSNYEAEGICVYNNKIYVSFNNVNYGASIELYSIIPYEN